MRFENIRTLYTEDKEQTRNNREFYIINGFYPTWAEEHRTDADRGIKEFSTALRWEQYKNGDITREQAISYAIKRMRTAWKKEYNKGLERIEAVENAEDIKYISVSVEWYKSRTWGYNPTAEVSTNTGRTYGSASGCGYDKESASIAQAFNKNNSILKVIYTMQENAIKNGISPKDTTCTGFNNRNTIGYGAGYNIAPYFEGGVGTTCFISILEKAGFKYNANHGKKYDTYNFYIA